MKILYCNGALLHYFSERLISKSVICNFYFTDSAHKMNGSHYEETKNDRLKASEEQMPNDQQVSGCKVMRCAHYNQSWFLYGCAATNMWFTFTSYYVNQLSRSSSDLSFNTLVFRSWMALTTSLKARRLDLMADFLSVLIGPTTNLIYWLYLVTCIDSNIFGYICRWSQ